LRRDDRADIVGDGTARIRRHARRPTRDRQKLRFRNRGIIAADEQAVGGRRRRAFAPNALASSAAVALPVGANAPSIGPLLGSTKR
jgi:hypothetical protein